MSTASFERLAAALADRYRIERELGAGGMATVYLAADLKHDRKVAIKVLKPELAAVLGAERFVVEIKTTAALQHPHILPLFDSGTADGFLFYVMPYIQGETIREKLNRETQFGVDEAVRITKEVAGALDYAHRNGVIHRDIKPENLLLHDGRAMVMDFGIALAVSAAAGGRMTETGLSLGTPHYMSPEQATAEKEISPRSDVYSLASVLYEMLAGQPPHIGGAAQQVIMKIITEQAQPVTALRHSVPLNVAAALARALEKLPADRFESAAKFAEALGDVSYSHATIGVNVSGTSRAAATPRAFLAVSVLAVAAVVAALWGWFRPTASEAVVLRDRIVLWDSLPIPLGAVGRGLAISRDGQTVVFTQRMGTAGQLFSKERDRLESAPIAGATAVAGGVAFSPDDQWIAFVGTDGRVKKVPRLGGSPIAIADSAYTASPSLAWLDGGTVLFIDAASGLRAVSEDGGVTRQLHAGTLDSMPKILRSVSGLPGGVGAMVMLCPPGCGASELYVIDLRVDAPQLTLLADQALAGWTLASGDAVFVRRDGGVFAAPFDLRALTFARPPIPVLAGVRTSNNTADMAVSRGGSVLYVAGPGFAMSADVTEPVWVDRAGVATPIDPTWSIAIPAGSLGLRGRRLALSPRGDRLAIGITRDGSAQQSDIWVKQLERPPLTLTKLTFDDDNANPVWTRDGLHIFYTSGGLSQRGSVQRRRADGTGSVDTLVRLARGINDVVLTPDSTRLILRLIAPASRDIVEWRLGDSTVTPMMALPNASETSPELSPDGRWIAYQSDESGQDEVYVRPYPNWASGRWQVTQAGGTAPLWSHSGRELFYRNGAGALMAAEVLPGATFTTGAHTRLFDATPFAGGVAALSYDVAPGDRRFVMLRRTRRPDAPGGDEQVVQIINWASELRSLLSGGARR